ncbi:hypothetical protein IWW38_001736 [Coemansia aciculifera]|uniref:Uncharacterized protein n=1 Tax=Coemansia aciculifera TaxID=417176 RepID=A0ACC1M5I5_9FUNG|nr:hypothetical protein IWW38_001736 [Coemansia aciculifera]
MSSLITRALVVTSADLWQPGTVKYKIRAGLVLSVYVLYLVYVIVTFVMFMRKSRDRHSGLSQRNVSLVMFQAVGGVVMGTAAMFNTALQIWPCFLKLWSLNIGFIIVYSSITARAIQHIIVSTVHILTNKVASSNAPALKGTMTPHSHAGFQREDDGPRHHRSGSQTSIFSNTDFEQSESTQGIIPNEKKHSVKIGSSSKVGRHTSLMRTDNGPEAKLFRRLQKYTRLQRLTTKSSLNFFVVCHIMLACILSLVINIVNTEFALSPMSTFCGMVWGFLPTIGFTVLYAVLILPVLLVKCWSLKDAYGIRNDLIASIVSGALFPLIGAIRHSRDVMLRIHGASGHGTALAAAIAGAGGEDGHLGKRAEFNIILADPFEYRFFCDFAASCFCSEMTAFIDEYQALKGLTVIALGSEDMWREDVDQLESSYMARMANNIDNDVGYLAMANRAYPHSKSLRLQTPPNVSILETARVVYPQHELADNTPFPVASMDKLVAIFSVFVNSNSYTAVSLPSSMVARTREKLGRSQLTLTILDEIKDEVLNMLYYDVFTRYSKKK